MLRVNNLVGFGVSAGKRTIIYDGTTNSIPAGGTPTTYSAFSIGAAANDRLVVVALTMAAVGAISSLTIGGVSATKVVGTSNGTQFTELWAAPVPSGTTADIVLGAGSGTFPRITISVFSIYGPGSVTPTETGTDTTSTYDASFSPPAGSVVIGAFSVGVLTTCTWTGLTEQLDAQQSPQTASSAMIEHVGGALSINVTPGTGGTAAFAAAAWNP
jgi:hypothetical protein